MLILLKRLEDDELRYKKVNQKDIRFFKQPKSTNEECEICCEKIISA